MSHFIRRERCRGFGLTVTPFIRQSVSPVVDTLRRLTNDSKGSAQSYEAADLAYSTTSALLVCPDSGFFFTPFACLVVIPQRVVDCGTTALPAGTVLDPVALLKGDLSGRRSRREYGDSYGGCGKGEAGR
jgi:hypothetical protein